MVPLWSSTENIIIQLFEMISLESVCSSRTIRWVALTLACLNILTSGSIFAVNVLINDIKEVFNLTQSNVEVIVASAVVGASVGPPVGWISDKFGPTVSFTIALVLGLGSCLLIFSSTFSTSFYHDNYPLLAVYAFVFGYATIVMYLTAVSISMMNFKSRHRGKVVAITGASWFSGPAVFSAVYTKIFAETSKLRGYFLLLGIVLFIANLIAAIFVKDYSHLVGELTNPDEDFILESEGVQVKRPQKWKNFLGLDLCGKLDFHLFSWAFFLSVGPQLMFLNNIAVFLESYGISRYITALLVTGPIVAATVKIACGALSDYFISSIPRASFVAIASLAQTIFMLANINHGDNAPLFVTTVIFLYICNAMYFSLFPALLSEMFGMRYFSRNFGGLVLAMAFVTLGLMAVFGKLYDRQADEDTRKCFGQQCFRDSLIISSVLSALGLLLCSIMVWRERRWRATQ